MPGASGSPLRLIAAMLALSPNWAQGQEVSPLSLPVAPEAGLMAQVTGTETFTYDTNPLLIVSGAKPLAGSTTAPELLLSDSSDAGKLSLDTTIDGNAFDRPQFDSVDGHEVIAGAYQTAQWAYAAKGTADYDTTRTSEITTFGIDLPRVRHTGFGIAPSVSYSPTLIDRLTLEGSAASARYDNAAFIGYDFYTVKPSYQHNFDPLNAGIFSLQAERYQSTTGLRQTTDSVGPSLGWLATLTPRLSLLVTSGFEETAQSGEASTLNGRSGGLDYVFSGAMKFAGLQDLAQVMVSRQQSPFSNGTEALLTSLSVAETHALNTRVSVVANAAYENAAYAQAAGVNLAAQLSLGGGVVYHASEHLDVSADYQYKNEKLTNIGGAILDNTVIFSLIFHPLGAAL
jgi:hypothetical protein